MSNSLLGMATGDPLTLKGQIVRSYQLSPFSTFGNQASYT